MRPRGQRQAGHAHYLLFRLERMHRRAGIGSAAADSTTHLLDVSASCKQLVVVDGREDAPTRPSLGQKLQGLLTTLQTLN